MYRLNIENVMVDNIGGRNAKRSDGFSMCEEQLG